MEAQLSQQHAGCDSGDDELSDYENLCDALISRVSHRIDSTHKSADKQIVMMNVASAAFVSPLSSAHR
jgi:hypothetical protein